MIYLDNAATTLKKPEGTAQAVLEAMGMNGNAGRGVNEASLHAARGIYQVREKLARLFHAEDPARIAFTCNSTEALNTALKGLLKPGDHVISTVLEHNSVLRPLYELQEAGVRLTLAGCDEKGRLKTEEIFAAAGADTRVIVTTHASNLTGNRVEIERIGAFARERGILYIVDASQSAGVLPIDVQAMGIDVLCFTGHKSLYGPQGTGGLYVRKGVEIRPLKTGGSGIDTFSKTHPREMPAALEAGTLNSHGLAGLSAALDFVLETTPEKIHERENTLLYRFLEGIRELNGITLYGDFEDPLRAPIAALNLEGMDSGEVGEVLFSDFGISVRTGGHCAPRLHEALGTGETGAVRFSFSWFTTEAEVDAAIEALSVLTEGA